MRRTDQPMRQHAVMDVLAIGFGDLPQRRAHRSAVGGRATMRRVSASALSAIGSAKISIGTPAASAVAPFCQPVMAVAASRKPASRLPLSPRKIDAGCEVEDQEPERGADERGEQHRFGRMTADDQDRAAGRAGERGDAGGEPVDAVDQVERIGQADQPRRRSPATRPSRAATSSPAA